MESNLSWTVLGSGSGNPSKDRACAGHLLSVDGSTIMFDCGSGVMSSYLRSMQSPFALESIIISHTHADHIADLPLFVQWLKVEKRSDRLTVYLPSEAINPVRGYLDAAYLFREKLPFELSIMPIIGNLILLDGIVKITAVENKHESGNRDLIAARKYPNRMECYSFLINVEDKHRIFYSGDVGSLEDIGEYLRDLDLLIIETSHIDIDEFADLLGKYSVRKVILSHIADDRFHLVRKFAQEYHGATEIIMAEDGLITAL